MNDSELFANKMQIGTDEEAAKQTVIVLHGIGTDEENLVPFIEHLNVPGNYFFIRGPFRYGPFGFSYFDVSFTPHGFTHDREQVHQSIQLLKEWVEERKGNGEIPAHSKLCFMGFSQGAIISYAMAFSFPDLVDKVIGLNGRVLTEIGANRPTDPHKKISVYAFYGLYDDVQPIHLAHEARERFQLSWIDLHYKEGACAHEVNDESADFARRALSSI